MKNNKHIFGYHAVESALKHTPKHVVALYLQSRKDDEYANELIQLATEHEIEISYLPRERLGELVFHANHQGIVAEITRSSEYTEDDLEAILQDPNIVPFILILDGVQDPHNLGACLRTANAFGVHAVIAPKDKACGLTPVVYKVASGAVDATPFIQVTNLARTMRLLKENNVWIYGTADNAKENIHEVKLTGPVALVLGAEGEGMRRLTRENCDFVVKIPMTGVVQNLNVSVATGVCLYEVRRQHLIQNKKP